MRFVNRRRTHRPEESSAPLPFADAVDDDDRCNDDPDHEDIVIDAEP